MASASRAHPVRALPVHTQANVDTHAHALRVFAQTRPCPAWLWASGDVCGAGAPSSARLCWRVPHNCHPGRLPPALSQAGTELGISVCPLLSLIMITFRLWHRTCQVHEPNAAPSRVSLGGDQDLLWVGRAVWG